MSEFGHHLFIKAGAAKDEIEQVPLRARSPTYVDWKAAMREDMIVSRVIFGPENQFEVFFDDDGLLKDSPISTLEINGHILHGPCAIWRRGQNRDGEDTSIGLTEEDIAYLKSSLAFLQGKGPRVEPMMEFTTFSTVEELIAASKH